MIDKIVEKYYLVFLSMAFIIVGFWKDNLSIVIIGLFPLNAFLIVNCFEEFQEKIVKEIRKLKGVKK